MSLTIETELKDIFIKIDQRLDRMEQGLNDLKLGQVEIKGEIKTLDKKLSGEIKTLDEKLSGEIKTLDEKFSGEIKNLNTKVDGLSTRVSNQELLLRTIVGGLIVIIIGGVAKMFWNFSANP